MAGEVHVSISGLEKLNVSLAQTLPMLDRLLSENETNARRTLQKVEFVLDDYTARTNTAYNEYQQALSELEYAKRYYEDVPEHYYRAVNLADAEYSRLSGCCDRIKSIRERFRQQSSGLCKKLAQEAEVYSAVLRKGTTFVEKYIDLLIRSRNAINDTGIAATSVRKDGLKKPSWNDICVAGSNTYRVSAYQGDKRTLLNGELPKNSTILIPLETSNADFCVKTDALGRVGEFKSPKVDYFGGDRSQYQQGKSVKVKDGLHGDDGGHLYPRQWGGPSELVNLVPMNAHVNRYGAWRNMEQNINEKLNYGNSVTDYAVKPLYEGSSRRPYGFEVSYVVNGEPHEVYIKNTVDNGA